MKFEEEIVHRIISLERQVERLKTVEISGRLAEVDYIPNLSGLRGYWPMSAFESNGDAFDQSGNGRTLTYNGNPTYNYDAIAPYIDLDGTGDHLSRADEAGLDILGTEAYVASAVQGMTFGGWFWSDATPAAISTLIAKYTFGVVYSYRLAQFAADAISFHVNSAAAVSVTSSVALVKGAWHLLVARFTPSTELAIFHDGVKTINTTGIPAALTNSNAPLAIGGTAGGGELDGRASLCFLCAVAHSDATIDTIFQKTRVLYGV